MANTPIPASTTEAVSGCPCSAGVVVITWALGQGFTRDFLDGKTSTAALLGDIRTSFSALSSSSDFVVIEGTGHTGVGAIREPTLVQCRLSVPGVG